LGARAGEEKNAAAPNAAQDAAPEPKERTARTTIEDYTFQSVIYFGLRGPVGFLPDNSRPQNKQANDVTVQIAKSPDAIRAIGKSSLVDPTTMRTKFMSPKEADALKHEKLYKQGEDLKARLDELTALQSDETVLNQLRTAQSSASQRYSRVPNQERLLTLEAAEDKASAYLEAQDSKRQRLHAAQLDPPQPTPPPLPSPPTHHDMEIHPVSHIDVDEGAAIIDSNAVLEGAGIREI